MLNKLSLKLDKSMISNVLFISLVTIGVILLIAGVFMMLISSSFPEKVSGINSMTQTIAAVVSFVPGIPINFTDLTSNGLTMMGIVSWAIGLDILLIGLGLWAKNKVAKMVALCVFSLAVFFNVFQLLFNGILGAPYAAVGIFTNLIFVYLLRKADF